MVTYPTELRENQKCVVPRVGGLRIVPVLARGRLSRDGEAHARGGMPHTGDYPVLVPSKIGGVRD